jgi:hypothetical protein
MVCNVSRPEQPAEMIYTMKPVIHKIFKEQEHDPVDPGIGYRLNDPDVIKKTKNKSYIYYTESQVNDPV